MGIRVKVGFKDSVGVQSGQNGQGENFFRASSAPPYVWPVAVDPWQLSGPGGQGGGEGGGVAYQNRGDVPPVPCRLGLPNASEWGTNFMFFGVTRVFFV